MRTPRRSPALRAPEAIRAAYRDAREQAIARFRAHPDPDALTRALTAATDRALRALWRMHACASQASLVAVGGFGRREQFPHSDVDLMVLTEGRLEAAQARGIEAFIGACWDCGLPIGHSVRSVDDCVAEALADVTVQTSLLELRWLAGSRQRCSEALDRLGTILDPRAFFSAKLVEMRQRHAKYDDTPYSLEPNTKESPGGLRDLQVLVWIARAARLGTRWRELAAQGLITDREAAQLRRNERRLKRIRATLHIVADRHEDRLVFDLQAQVAHSLGIGGDDARRASEELMQHYYWAAKAVVQLNTIVLQNLRTALFPQHDARGEPIDALFRNVHGLLDANDPRCFERQPSSILQAFRTMQAHPELSGIATPTLRALWNARTRIDSAFRRDPANRALFLQILQAPRGITHELRRMNQWSILGHYLPPFRRIVGRMQHDLFHVYTVDQHILMVVRNLRRFTMPEHAHEYPLCSELMAGFARPWLLYVAALFHDIAKGRGGDHSTLGRIDARRFCRDHGLADEDRELVEFLVLHHLTLSSVAQKQDPGDPAVVARFAALVGTEERLVALYLLTVADIRGTSPKVWNAWKGKLLEDLFFAARHALQGHAPSTRTRVEAVRRDAAHLLSLYGLAQPSYARFWQQLDVPYFLRHEAQDVAWHVRALHAHVDTRVPIVRSRLSPIGEGFELVVYLPDQPDLFARICGYFDSRRLSVLEARIQTTRHGYALDTFVLVAPGGVAHSGEALRKVQEELARRLAERAELAEPVEGRSSRRSRHFPIEPSLELQADERGQRYLLSIVANDRTGLLYRIARVLARHRINVQTARITTLGERVEDVFLIDGETLERPRESRQFQTELLQALRA
ncbi:MAG: [protein-PII] uridylyltransferase [Burkholderiaceae bacterium]|nr:[protein-PII] uridylyltransferase [Burkholderiaceae bacterium]